MSEPSNATASESYLALNREDWARKCQRIDAALDAYSRLDADCPSVLRDAIRHSLLAPGKRLRPLLLLLATEACGADWQTGIPAGCAIEMVHTYSLIHDDLPAMDDDDAGDRKERCLFDKINDRHGVSEYVARPFESVRGRNC